MKLDIGVRTMTDADLPAISHLSLDAKRKLLLRLARDVRGSQASVHLSDRDHDVIVMCREIAAAETLRRHVASRTQAEWDELTRLANAPDDELMALEEVLNLPWDKESASTPRRSP